MDFPKCELQDSDDLQVLLEETRYLLDKYHKGTNYWIYICFNCDDCGLTTLQKIVDRSLCFSGDSLPDFMSIKQKLPHEYKTNLRIEWLKQLEEKLLSELKGN